MKEEKFNFFDYINSFNSSKQDLFRENEDNQKEYNPYMINRTFSYFYDTILYANEMNFNWHIDKKMQHDFYMNSIPKRNRFTRWHKKDKIEDRVKLIMKEYDYSEKRAISVLNFFSEQDFEILENKYSQGGKNNK